jgi:hypothetical protein
LFAFSQILSVLCAPGGYSYDGLRRSSNSGAVWPIIAGVGGTLSEEVTRVNKNRNTTKLERMELALARFDAKIGILKSSRSPHGAAATIAR